MVSMRVARASVERPIRSLLWQVENVRMPSLSRLAVGRLLEAMTIPNGNGAPLDNTWGDNGGGDTPPAARRSITRSALLDVARNDSDGLVAILERLALHHAVRGLIDGLRSRNKFGLPNRGWHRLFWELTNRLKVQPQIQNLILTELGMPMDVVRRRLAMVKSVEGIDESDAVSVMEQHVRAWYRERGKRVVIVDDAAEGIG